MNHRASLESISMHYEELLQDLKKIGCNICSILPRETERIHIDLLSSEISLPRRRWLVLESSFVPLANDTTDDRGKHNVQTFLEGKESKYFFRCDS